MLCPKCKKEMKIIYHPVYEFCQDGAKHAEVLGRCEDCDFDATWQMVLYRSGEVKEFNLQRYFFG